MQIIAPMVPLNFPCIIMVRGLYVCKVSLKIYHGTEDFDCNSDVIYYENILSCKTVAVFVACLFSSIFMLAYLVYTFLTIQLTTMSLDNLGKSKLQW